MVIRMIVELTNDSNNTMEVLLLGASGRIGQRIANELLSRGHTVTGPSRSGEIDGVDDPNFASAAVDATDADEIATRAADYDAVVSALGPSESEEVDVFVEMAEAVLEGFQQTDTDRLVWTGGAGGLSVGPETRLIETDDFPDELVPLSGAHRCIRDHS
jgi:putative NADH-flavin reductase